MAIGESGEAPKTTTEIEEEWDIGFMCGSETTRLSGNLLPTTPSLCVCLISVETTSLREKSSLFFGVVGVGNKNKTKIK